MVRHTELLERNLMPSSDPISDESLALSCAGGNNADFDILFNRYAGEIRLRLKGKSWFRDDDQYIDELVGQVFEVLWQCLKANKFESQGEGSFRKWLLGLCQLECYKQDGKRAKLPKTTSVLFPTSFANIPLPAKKETEPVDEELHKEQVNKRLKEALSKLTPEEQELMQLVADGVRYGDILKKFPEYKSIDSIKKKIYRIRQRFKQTCMVRVIRPGSEHPEVKYCPAYIAFKAV